MRAFVGVTVQSGFERLRRLNSHDVNFWRPSDQGFQAPRPGDPFLFKLHAPRNTIAGGGLPRRGAATDRIAAMDGIQ